MRCLVPLVLSALALTACGVAGAPTAKTAAIGSAATRAAGKDAGFFTSAKAGTSWHYKVTSHYLDTPEKDYTGFVATSVESAARRNGETRLQLREYCDYTAKYRFPELVESAQGVTVSGVDFLGSCGSEADGYRFDFLRFPLSTGARWDDGQFIGKVKGQVAVETPVGRFDATKIEVIGVKDQQYTVTGAYYVARGVGIVKSEYTAYAQDFTCVLDGYRP